MATWGSFKWGAARWGGDVLDPNQQGFYYRAKQDTYYLGQSTGASAPFADFDTDLSGLGLGFTDAGNGHPELSNAEVFDITGPRSLEFLVQAVNSGTDTLIDVDDASNGYGLVIDSGTIKPTINGSADSNGNHAIPGISAGTRRYAICWTTEHNRDTTGASDAMRSWIYVCEVDGNQAWSQTTWTHAAQAAQTNPTAGLFGNGGTNILANEAYLARVSNRFHTAAEFFADFVQSTTPPSLTAEKRPPRFVPDSASGIADQSQHTGIVESMVGAAVRDMDLWNVAPLVNENYQNATRYTQSFTPTEKWIAAFGDANYKLYLGFWLWRPVADSINAWRARVHISHDASGGGTLGVRVYSANKGPTLDKLILKPQPEPEIDRRFATQTVNPTVAPTDEWLTFAIRPFAKDSDGGTFFALAFSADTAGIQWAVNSWVVDGLLDKTTGKIPTIGQLKP